MKLSTAPFHIQSKTWPSIGPHILAHFDESSVIVYQAYRPSIGNYAIANQRFGGPDYSFQRMSWIKPNFLWMMYRCGWGTKPGQEVILGLRIGIRFFESILEQAVPSGYDEQLFSTHAEWKSALAESEVRLQWDPDHAPQGQKLERRAIQLGLRGTVLKRFAESELLEVLDLTRFVESQRPFMEAASEELCTPIERVYVPQSKRARQRLKL